MESLIYQLIVVDSCGFCCYGIGLSTVQQACEQAKILKFK